MLCLGINDAAAIQFGIKQQILTKLFQIVKKECHNEQFKLIEDNAKWIDSRSEESTYSLNIDKFKMLKMQLKKSQKAKSYFSV
jgi:hypothetical protein